MRFLLALAIGLTVAVVIVGLIFGMIRIASALGVEHACNNEWGLGITGTDYHEGLKLRCVDGEVIGEIE